MKQVPVYRRWWVAHILAPLVLLAHATATAADKPVIRVSDEARRIHAESFVFDGHNDLPWTMRTEAGSSFDKADIAGPVPQFHTDLPRLRKGGVGAVFWSVYVPAETSKEGKALLQTMEQIELVKAMVARYPDDFALATTADEVVAARQSGKIASLIGMEGGHCIEDSLENLRRLHAMGARYMTLTHSDTLGWADAATDEPKHAGLTPFGEEVVREMNRLGMLVDLSHVSPETMRDALRVSKAPVIFSHSSAYAVAAHPRNVPDDILKLTAENDGVVMVNFFSGFIHPESAKRRANMFQVNRELRAKHPTEQEFKIAKKRWEAEHPIEPGSVYDVVDHIEHIIRVAGIDHVGLGSDYDGIMMVPKQLEDVSTFPVITQELLNRGYKAEQIHKLMSGNIMRVLRKAQAVAESKP
ncbi:MAG: dipeptidase [Pirellulales bacterium]